MRLLLDIPDLPPDSLDIHSDTDPAEKVRRLLRRIKVELVLLSGIQDYLPDNMGSLVDID